MLAAKFPPPILAWVGAKLANTKATQGGRAVNLAWQGHGAQKVRSPRPIAAKAHLLLLGTWIPARAVRRANTRATRGLQGAMSVRRAIIVRRTDSNAVLRPGRKAMKIHSLD